MGTSIVGFGGNLFMLTTKKLKTQRHCSFVGESTGDRWNKMSILEGGGTNIEGVTRLHGLRKMVSEKFACYT